MSYPKTFRSLLALASMAAISAPPHVANLVANPYKPSNNERELSMLDKQRIEAAKLKRERKAKQKASRL